jgi:hypothetical protein
MAIGDKFNDYKWLTWWKANGTDCGLIEIDFQLQSTRWCARPTKQPERAGDARGGAVGWRR